MVTSAEERTDNESYKFGGTQPDKIFLKTGTVGSDGTPIDINPVRKDLEGGGKTAVGTSAVEVEFTGTTNSIIITADTSNSGILYVGKSDVTNTGDNSITFLLAGQWISVDYDDSDNAFYVVASASGQNFWSGAIL